jgi:hypothetical protein
MGKIVPVNDLMPVTRASDYDKDIDEALKMPAEMACMIELGQRKLDSVNIALRDRIKKRGLSNKLHVEVRRDKDNKKGVYMLHGPSPSRAKAAAKKK